MARMILRVLTLVLALSVLDGAAHAAAINDTNPIINNGAGLQVGTPTGSVCAPGASSCPAGTINAQTYLANGVPITGGGPSLINVSSSYTTVAGNATICVADAASPPTITLGASLPANTSQTVTDCGGDAAAQNITVVAATGTISGFTNVVFNQNGTSQSFLYTGTAWVMQ
jgi:hypothetical protein